MEHKLINFKRFSLDKALIIVSIAIYFVLGLFLLQNYLYIINSDGISYISIAQHYMQGRFEYAINGYWSPLSSWLLIPFLLIWTGKISALYATKILALLIGFLTLVGVYLFTNKLNFDVKLKGITLFTLIPLILFFALDTTIPDLLVVCILIFYLNYLYDPKYSKNLINGILSGFLGALAFLSKSYIFFFFLLHFSISNLYYWIKFKERRKTIFKNFLLGLSIFLIISGVWIFAISEKYDKFTIGTAGAYNYAVIGPESTGHPVYDQGLLKPPNEFAYSIWEDPSYLKVKPWGPFSSIENFNFQLKIITNNLWNLLNILETFSILSILILVLGLFLVFLSINEESRCRLVLLILTIAIYSTGYCLILVEIRYLWFINVLLLLLGIFSVKTLFEKFSINKSLYIFVVLSLSVSFLFYPVMGFYEVNGKGKDAYILAENLKSQIQPGSNIATNYTDWRNTNALAYYLDVKYYGLSKSSSSKELEEELRINNIQYYFIWQNTSIDIPGYIKIEDFNFESPQVYRQVVY